MSEDALIASVGARLGQLRRAAGLTQQTMADRLKIGLRSYQGFESGRSDMHLRTVAKLAAALGVGPGEFFVQSR